MKFTVMIVQLSKILTKNLGKIDLLVNQMNQKSRSCSYSGSVGSSGRITYEKYSERKSMTQYIFQYFYFRLTMNTDTTGAVIDINTGVYTSKASGVFKVGNDSLINLIFMLKLNRQSSVFLCRANKQQTFGLK